MASCSKTYSSALAATSCLWLGQPKYHILPFSSMMKHHLLLKKGSLFAINQCHHKRLINIYSYRKLGALNIAYTYENVCGQDPLMIMKSNIPSQKRPWKNM